MRFPESNFWDYSIRCYANTSVQRTCLSLQESHNADVNVLLFIAWKASNNTRLEEDSLEKVKWAVYKWHNDIVLPLRSIRQALKADSKGADTELASVFRGGVKRIELESEHIEQLMLETCKTEDATDCVVLETRRLYAIEGISAYLEGLGSRLNEVDNDSVKDFVYEIVI